MALYDQFGSPLGVSQKFAHAANRSGYRGTQFPMRNADIDTLIPAHDRQGLASLSRRLYTNMGVPRAAVNQKADYSIGEAWLPVYGGEDEAGADASEWLKEVFYPMCDVRGGVFDWHRLLSLVSIAMDRDGDTFLLLTRSAGGFPQVQHIPGHMVRSKAGDLEVEKGAYRGLPIRDGVIYNGKGRAVAYRVYRGEETGETNFRDISARDLIHLFDPTYQEQGRGLPAFTHALEDLKHCLQSTEYERVAQMMISSIGLIEHNELGGPDPDDPSYDASIDSSSETGITSEIFDGGTVRYFKAKSGGKLETITHDRPGDVWESFQDRMARAALAGVGWSYSLVWKCAGQGTAERMEVEIARRSIVQRQKILAWAARRVVTYALAVGDEEGLVRAPATMRWGFTRPPRLSVDDGREAKSQIESWRAGKVNDTDILGHAGKTPAEHYRQRAEEEALKQRIAKEIEEKYAAEGVKIDQRMMGMLTPNDQRDEEDEK